MSQTKNSGAGNFSRREFLLMSVFSFMVQMCKTGTRQTVARLPLNARLVLLGDSITHMGLFEDVQMLKYPAIGISFTNEGYGNVANILSGSRFYVPVNGNQGVNGDTVAGVLCRLPAVIALKPAVVLLLIGTNSIFNNVPEESVMDDYRSICDKLIANGTSVIAPTILPRFAGFFSELTPSQENVRKNINSFILAQTDITSVDVESHLKSPSYFLDGLHPNSVGVYRLASKIAPILDSLIVPGKVQEMVGASDNYVTNPTMTGTKGTLENAFGKVADNWNLVAKNAAGATVTGSKSAGDDKQVIQIAGTYTGKVKDIQIKNENVVSLHPSDIVEGFLEIEIMDSFTNISTLNLIISGFNADKNEMVMNGEAFYNSEHSHLQLPGGRYILRTPPLQLVYPVTNLTACVSILFTDAVSSSGVSGKFKIHHCLIRKLV